MREAMLIGHFPFNFRLHPFWVDTQDHKIGWTGAVKAVGNLQQPFHFTRAVDKAF